MGFDWFRNHRPHTSKAGRGRQAHPTTRPGFLNRFVERRAERDRPYRRRRLQPLFALASSVSRRDAVCVSRKSATFGASSAVCWFAFASKTTRRRLLTRTVVPRIRQSVRGRSRIAHTPQRAAFRRGQRVVAPAAVRGTTALPAAAFRGSSPVLEAVEDAGIELW